MTPTNIIDGALCRLNNDRLQYQMRVGQELLWAAWFRESDGNHFELVWAQSETEARIKASQLFPHRPITIEADYIDNPIASGWTSEQKSKAMIWHADLIATKRVAERFAPVKEAAE